MADEQLIAHGRGHPPPILGAGGFMSPADSSPYPMVTCSADGTELRVMPATGLLITIDAAKLRAACRCAQCRRAQIDGDFPDSFDGVTIRAVSWVGGYGVNVTFSDGHARGIFPFAYLTEIAAGRGGHHSSEQAQNPLILQDLV
jgi:prepilin-type processing-associated H-X9-DG protein